MARRTPGNVHETDTATPDRGRADWTHENVPMDATTEVIRAAQDRAAAAARRDGEQLRALLHADFRWVSHAGERFDRDSFVATATDEGWPEQELTDFSVVAHEQTAVLRCTIVDATENGYGQRDHRMPMTQVWVLRDGQWLCLAGHAGART